MLAGHYNHTITIHVIFTICFFRKLADLIAPILISERTLRFQNKVGAASASLSQTYKIKAKNARGRGKSDIVINNKHHENL